jgi:catalase
MQSAEGMRAFASHAERLDGTKVRARSPSFGEHYSQATLFWNSLSETEKAHLVAAAHFELGKVDAEAVRQRMLDHFNHVDHCFAVRVAGLLGMLPPAEPATRNHGQSSAALSQANAASDSIAGRKVAVLVADGFEPAGLEAVKTAVQAGGGTVHLVAARGTVLDDKGGTVKADKMFVTAGSIMFDAVVVAGGAGSLKLLRADGDAVHFVQEAFRHAKPWGRLTRAWSFWPGCPGCSSPRARTPGRWSSTSAW